MGRFSAIAGDVDGAGANEVWLSSTDTSSRPHDVLGLASGATGAFLGWMDLVRMPVHGQP